MRKLYDLLQKKPFIGCISLAFFLTFAVECLCRHSVLKACVFFLQNPLGFLFNTLIILTTLSVTLLFSKRLFGYIVVSAFWLVLGVVSFVLKFFRVTPLSASDFRIFKSISDIFGVYLSKGQSILIFVSFGALAILVPILWKKTPRWHVSRKRSAMFASCIAAFLCLTATSAGAAFSNFTNLPDAYANYGFPYCFSLSVVDSGIKKPADYSPETMSQIAEKVETSTGQTVTAYTSSQATVQPQTENAPNILFLQLESFFDVNDMTDVTFSQNPIPNFSALRESCPGGYITVPAYGCGTANSEFELISGMNLDYFGPNEYPYSTILKDHTCESLAYDLKQEGYGTHAIHNNRGTFYDRRHVYANLGFDTFTCLEYMHDITYNQLGWAKDTVLTDEIMKALNSTDTPDYIYTVAVQTHGKYPTELEQMDSYPIQVQGDSLTPERQAQLTYYADQMQQTDAFLGDLISALSSYEEPVILVAYGDHLPSLGLTEEELINGSLYQTPYIVWSNYGFTMDSQDLEAYQLGSEVLEALGITNGYLNQLHQSRMSNRDYQADLNALQYDMLYGQQQIFGGVSPYLPTDLKLGIDDITLNRIEKNSTGLYLYGDNLTEYSEAMVGDKVVTCQRINSTTLWVPITETQPETGDSICIAQVTSKGTVLSTSNSLVY